jgi:class 3 adenylate cyclase/CHASE2 domain-containing sensor protein
LLSKTRATLCCSGFFVSLPRVKLKPVKRVPALIAFGVIALVCLLRLTRLDFLERLEDITFDMRVREAVKFSPPVATNLGFICIDENSAKAVWNRSIGFHFGLLWPRQVYGRLVQELALQGAKAVAFDIILGEVRDDQAPVLMADGTTIESDEFFARQMHAASNTIIAVTKEITPPALFLTNALALGDVTIEKDPDGVLRRVQIFRLATNWHAVFKQAAAEYGLQLDQARFKTNLLVLPAKEAKDVEVPLDAEGNFDLADFVGDKIPAGMTRKAKPFTVEPIWHMGVVLAAQELKLDLSNAQIDLAQGFITLRGPGVVRAIPVDKHGYAYVNWSIPPNAPALTQQPIEELLRQNFLRLQGSTNQFENLWRGKLAVVGSSALVGNNLTDRGATPLSADTLLVSKHWNVANSVITNQFVRRSPLVVDLDLIALLGLVAAWATWNLRVPLAAVLIVSAAVAYVLLATIVYIKTRYWIPVILPLLGAQLMNYVCLSGWRIVFEQAQQRRIKTVFSTVVSPKIMKELLDAPTLSLGGARREITVMFADVRGFTEFTDIAQERAAEFVKKNNLSGAAAEAFFDQQARETLNTVNLYLGLVADTIVRADATLDKFIGDCVMAFWGAPTPNPQHAVSCVRAAIAAQRAIYGLNQQRAAENKRLELENLTRTAAGLEPLPLLPVLLLGSGINTGLATVGLMGSETKTGVGQGNYTVFGREVNLASRLESLSGRGRIFVSETTHEHLLRDDPHLASICVAQPPAKVKGISAALNVYEVPWLPQGAKVEDTELIKRAVPDTTSFVHRAAS